MKVSIDNLQDFFFAVDGENDYSAVIEATDNQPVIYIYNREKSEIVRALLIPGKIKLPYDIEVIWDGNVCQFFLPNQQQADYDVTANSGHVSSNFSGNWV